MTGQTSRRKWSTRRRIRCKHTQPDQPVHHAAWRAGRIGISDEKTLRVMRKASGSQNLEAFLHFPDKRREGTLARMSKAGASLSLIVRQTCTSMAIVRKMLGS